MKKHIPKKTALVDYILNGEPSELGDDGPLNYKDNKPMPKTVLLKTLSSQKKI